MDPPAGLTLQEMARQRATLQATERMRILKWALASVNDSIAFCDDQELHEAFNQVEVGVQKMGKAIIKIAEAQQQQREADFLDSSADTVTIRPACAPAACAKCAEARERLTRWLQTENRENVRAHRAQGHLPPPPTTADDAGDTAAAAERHRAQERLHDRCWGHSCTCRLQKMQRLLHRHSLQTAAEDAAATPPPPPALLPSGATSGSRSRSPSREIPTAGWRDPDL